MRRKFLQRSRNRPASHNQIGNDAFVDVEIAFVFAEIADVMALGEHSPNFGAQPERMRQHLKHHKPVAGAITVMAQRGQTEGVRCVIGEIKPPFERIGYLAGVFEPVEAGAPETGEFSGVGRLDSERLARPGPASRSSGELIFAPEQPEFRLCQHALDERIAVTHPLR